MKMNNTCVFLTLLFLLTGFDVAEANDQDTVYIDNIRNYLDSITTFRYEVKCTGVRDYGTSAFKSVLFEYEDDYKLLYDVEKKLWKLESQVRERPVGVKEIGDYSFSSDELKSLMYPKHNTINKIQSGYTKYFHKDSGENTSNMAVLMGHRQTRDESFRYAMQQFDPRLFLTKAVPRDTERLVKVSKDDNYVTLRYEMVKHPGLFKVIVLAKEYGYLPVKLTSEGKHYKDRETMIEISYVLSNTGYVVSRIKYNGDHGLCDNIYTKVAYNDAIEEGEFQIVLPPDAMIVDDLGNVYTHGQYEYDKGLLTPVIPGGAEETTDSDIENKSSNIETDEVQKTDTVDTKNSNQIEEPNQSTVISFKNMVLCLVLLIAVVLAVYYMKRKRCS